MQADFPANTDWHLLPEGARPAIERYVRTGRRPLSRFLIATLENDMAGTLRHGGRLRALMDTPDLLSFMERFMPPRSWGSPRAVLEWEYSGGLDGMRRIQIEPFESLARELHIEVRV